MATDYAGARPPASSLGAILSRFYSRQVMAGRAKSLT